MSRVKVVAGILVAGLVAGCGMQVERITASELDKKKDKGPVPQELVMKLERDIRSIVGTIHKSGSKQKMEKGRPTDEYRIWAEKISFHDNLVNRFTGEYFDCSIVGVTFQFNYHKTYYDKQTGRTYVSNTERNYREDEICSQQSTGHQQYRAGKLVRLQ